MRPPARKASLMFVSEDLMILHDLWCVSTTLICLVPCKKGGPHVCFRRSDDLTRPLVCFHDLDVFVDPSYIANPDFPQPPNFPPSLIYPPVGPFSHQQSVVIPESSGSVAMDRLPSLPVAPASEPHFIVYVGNIASTVDNDFCLSLLQVCGLVKSWKRVSNPCGGTPIKFGFCEFGSGEDSLRAKRLLNKLSVDGQELVVNVNAATKEYLEKYGENATEEKVEEAEMQKIRCMIEERRRTKLPGSPTSPVQTSASIGDADGDGNIRGSALEERKVRRRCEKEEHLGEMKALGSQGWEGREVTAAVKSSLQIDAASSMDVAKKHNTVNDERKSQHNAKGDGFHKSNDEERALCLYQL